MSCANGTCPQACCVPGVVQRCIDRLLQWRPEKDRGRHGEPQVRAARVVLALSTMLRRPHCAVVACWARPTVFASVPRLLNKLYDTALQKVRAIGALLLVDCALDFRRGLVQASMQPPRRQKIFQAALTHKTELLKHNIVHDVRFDSHVACVPHVGLFLTDLFAWCERRISTTRSSFPRLPQRKRSTAKKTPPHACMVRVRVARRLGGRIRLIITGSAPIRFAALFCCFPPLAASSRTAKRTRL